MRLACLRSVGLTAPIEAVASDDVHVTLWIDALPTGPELTGPVWPQKMVLMMKVGLGSQE